VIVSPFVLSVLKYSLLVLLYFFVFRAIRSVAVDVGGRKRGTSTRVRTPAPASTAKPAKGGRPPTQVVVHDAGGGKPLTVKLREPVEIGRGDRCAIRLQDTYVSQVHARLYAKDGTWCVEDLGSTNGTLLNDRRVDAPVEVHAGDVLKIGKTVLELRR
jgi:FHA domain